MPTGRKTQLKLKTQTLDDGRGSYQGRQGDEIAGSGEWGADSTGLLQLYRALVRSYVEPLRRGQGTIPRK